jgi:hypothetical protein
MKMRRGMNERLHVIQPSRADLTACVHMCGGLSWGVLLGCMHRGGPPGHAAPQQAAQHA